MASKPEPRISAEAHGGCGAQVGCGIGVGVTETITAGACQLLHGLNLSFDGAWHTWSARSAPCRQSRAAWHCLHRVLHGTVLHGTALQHAQHAARAQAEAG